MKREILITLAATAAVLLTLYILFAFAPLARKLGERRSLLAAKQAELQEARDLVARYDEFQEKSARIRMEAQRLEERIPTTARVPDLLKTVTRAAAECNLKDFQFTPREPVPGKYVTQQPITLTVGCGYHDLGRFLTRLAEAPRLIVATAVKINQRSSPEEQGSITAEIQLVTYVLNPEPAPKPEPEPEGEAVSRARH